VYFDTNLPLFYKSYYPIPHRPVNFPVIKYGSYRIRSGIIESPLDVKKTPSVYSFASNARSLFYQPVCVMRYLSLHISLRIFLHFSFLLDFGTV